MKKQIPNIITLLNLSAGVTAIVIALQNNKLAIAAMMVVLASFSILTVWQHAYSV